MMRIGDVAHTTSPIPRAGHWPAFCEWVSIASGEGWVPRAEVCAVAGSLMGDVPGGFNCDQTLRAFAHIVPSHQEDV
jgi:hypothetical protein